MLDAYIEIRIIDHTLAKQCLGSWKLELTDIKNKEIQLEDCQGVSLVAHATTLWIMAAAYVNMNAQWRNFRLLIILLLRRHNHASNIYYYGRFVTECLEKWNRRTTGAPNEIILTSDEDPVGFLCVEGYKYTEAVKVAAGLWGIPVVYYNRDKNCITRQFVEPVY